MDNEELALKLQRCEDRAKSNTRRIEEAEKKLEDNAAMIASISTLSDRQQRMEDDIKEMKGDVKAIVAKPGKRWDTIVEKALLCVVTALVVYALSKLGID
ncbi:MAG: hypothetical protein IJ299_00785 [Oscillospiraceae bacterium]|nr:hypothetical protein [Oscillospiraceae bacterium]